MNAQMELVRTDAKKRMAESKRIPAKTVFPVTITACREQEALVPWKGGPFTVGILDIKLKSGPVVLVNGNRIEIPYGAKKRITVRALKELAKAYIGSVIMAKKGSAYVRMTDLEVIEIPEAGGQVEIKSLPSFQTE